MLPSALGQTSSVYKRNKGAKVQNRNFVFRFYAFTLPPVCRPGTRLSESVNVEKRKGVKGAFSA